MTKLKNISKISNWFEGLNEPLIIAGPCSAESEEQVMQTAHEIAASGKVKVFRSGIWKPRTRPGNFENVGEEGLRWLQRVRKETGLLTAIEVANPEHAEQNLNIRDFASINELAVLSNLETVNAELVKQEISKNIRFKQLQEIANYQLKIMNDINLTKSMKKLTDETYIKNK